MKESLRIVHCFRSPVGGVFRHVRDLAEAQAAAGHRVGIICDSTTGGDFEQRLFEEMRGTLALGVNRIPMQRHIGLGDAAAAWKTFQAVWKLRPDILHGHGAKGGVYARLFGSVLRVFRSRVARLYSPHGGSLHYDESAWTGRMLFALERMMAPLTDHLLFVSHYERDTFRRKIGEPRMPSSLVYNGVRPEEFEPVAPLEGAADFLFIGMMRDLKGPDIFIEAIAEAEQALGRQLTATMVGEGDDRPRYQAQAARLGLAERIRFAPPMPARQAFALAKTLVVPSRAEAMPYIVLEALAAGKPVIASAVGGIPEILGPDSPALTSPEPGALASSICEAMQAPKRLVAAMPPRAALEARFSSGVMAKRIEEVYFAALGNPRWPRLAARAARES